MAQEANPRLIERQVQPQILADPSGSVFFRHRFFGSTLRENLSQPKKEYRLRIWNNSLSCPVVIVIKFHRMETP
jgi:hypothetical protein